MNLILGGFGKVRLGAGKPGLFQVQHANPGAGCGCNLGDEDLTIHTAAPVEGGLVQGPPCCEAGGGVIARHGFPPLTPPESTGIARHPRLQGLRRGLLKEKALHVLCINPGLTGPCIIPESPAGPLWWEGGDQGLIRAGGVWHLLQLQFPAPHVWDLCAECHQHHGSVQPWPRGPGTWCMETGRKGALRDDGFPLGVSNGGDQ